MRWHRQRPYIPPQTLANHIRHGYEFSGLSPPCGHTKSSCRDGSGGGGDMADGDGACQPLQHHLGFGFNGGWRLARYRFWGQHDPHGPVWLEVDRISPALLCCPNNASSISLGEAGRRAAHLSAPPPTGTGSDSGEPLPVL